MILNMKNNVAISHTATISGRKKKKTACETHDQNIRPTMTKSHKISSHNGMSRMKYYFFQVNIKLLLTKETTH